MTERGVGGEEGEGRGKGQKGGERGRAGEARLDHRSMRRQTFPIRAKKEPRNVIVAFSLTFLFFFSPRHKRPRGGVTGDRRFLSSYKWQEISAKRAHRELKHRN